LGYCSYFLANNSVKMHGENNVVTAIRYSNLHTEHARKAYVGMEVGHHLF
jgi:hypothetical protein